EARRARVAAAGAVGVDEDLTPRRGGGQRPAGRRLRLGLLLGLLVGYVPRTAVGVRQHARVGVGGRVAGGGAVGLAVVGAVADLDLAIHHGGGAARVTAGEHAVAAQAHVPPRHGA